MNENRKKRLVDLGAEALADALLTLARQDDAADDLVERMVATPEENRQRFKAKLAALKRSRRFIRWGESAAFARALRALLQDVQAGVNEPQMGCELVAAFYQTDKGALGNCDDSSGHWLRAAREHLREIMEFPEEYVEFWDLEEQVGVTTTMISALDAERNRPIEQALITPWDERGKVEWCE